MRHYLLKYVGNKKSGLKVRSVEIMMDHHQGSG